MINNYPKKSIRFKAKDMRVTGFLSRQIVREVNWYFSCKIRKSPDLSLVMKNKRKNNTAKNFNKLKHPC